jgi:hypothetical protein
VRWNLDTDGDMYGDERERLHWYELYSRYVQRRRVETVPRGWTPKTAKGRPHTGAPLRGLLGCRRSRA